MPECCQGAHEQDDSQVAVAFLQAGQGKTAPADFLPNIGEKHPREKKQQPLPRDLLQVGQRLSEQGGPPENKQGQDCEQRHAQESNQIPADAEVQIEKPGQ